MRLRAILEGIDDLTPGVPVSRPERTRLNARYQPALALAELILRAASTADGGRKTLSTSFVFDMNKVFEDFVAAALREALVPYGGRLLPQVTEVRLSDRIPLKPDLVWRRAGRWQAVLDVKYKALVSESFPNADAYQMLAYTLAYGLQEGWLIYAKSPEQQSRVHVIESAGKQIRVVALDVTRSPSDLLNDVDSLAREVAQRSAAPRVVAA